MKQPKKSVSITLDTEAVKKLKVLAEKDNRSLSQYINRLLKQHIDAVKEDGGTTYTCL